MARWKMEFVGKTTDGVLIVKNAFYLVDTLGIPLEIVLDRLHEQKLMPDWIQFYKDAVTAGWRPDGLMTKLKEAIGEEYGPDFREGWEAKMNTWLSM